MWIPMSRRMGALGLALLIPAMSMAAPGAARVDDLFGRDNLVAWCVVPFDGKHRGPQERGEMLERLGFTAMAYDWREEHIPSFDEELTVLRERGIELTGFWAPAGMNEHMRLILDALERQETPTQLWVSMGEPEGEDDAAKVRAAADQLRPVVEAAREHGCTVGLYNHMGWFGQPENQVAILEELDMPNVGIVYNQHHGHEHIDRFAELLELMTPHLYCLNLNGMVRGGEELGKKIVPIGHGDTELELELLGIIAASDYSGPIGIIGHTMDDVEERLLDNLEGLEWLKAQLRGEDAGPRPEARTYHGE